ncbi:hypothetical protein [Microbulbifer hydrolyticus]|uniref:Uncharacterized protein n=1 Tax=Microbulbifer hydrolyticus TaxID=48074 RepID=A0AA89T3G0_9GAMM|nr:hypothetical protein [Microbulbifer hydrolyticus]MBB5210444.1 hypothetical protein [Microbulbifer hydrolyticus]
MTTDYTPNIDVELMKFTLLLKDKRDFFTDRYSERKETSEEFSKRIDQRSM